jgi:cytochrome c553
MKRRLRRAAWVFVALVALVALVVTSGVLSLKASSGHSAPVAWFLNFALERSVATHSIGIDPPPLDDGRLVRIGAGHFEGGCRPCHGSPATRRPIIPLAMTPTPPLLPRYVEELDDAELFYIVLHGVKFTGMPAWPAQTRDDEVWAIVAFLRVLPRLDADAYERLVHGDAASRERAAEGVAAAPAVVTRRCARCHGLDGRGGDEGAFPVLASQSPEYLLASLEAYAKGRRYSGIMQPIAVELDADDAREAARWYAERPPVSASGEHGHGLGAAIARAGIAERRIPPCVDCHGPGGGPHRAIFPRLAGQHAPYLEEQLRLFSRRARGGTSYAALMRSVTEHGLTSAEIAAVARFYAAIAPARPDGAQRGR